MVDVLVGLWTFLLVWQITCYKQLKGGKKDFGSQLQRFQSVVSLFHYSGPETRQNILVEGKHGGGVCWLPTRKKSERLPALVGFLLLPFVPSCPHWLIFSGNGLADIPRVYLTNCLAISQSDQANNQDKLSQLVNGKC
jgi:hypothetical protein